MGRLLLKNTNKTNASFLLWKELYIQRVFLTQIPFGGVSISNQFSDFSKSLMIEFMKSNYYDPYCAIHSPKKGL
jgi:hypothetical protein